MTDDGNTAKAPRWVSQSLKAPKSNMPGIWQQRNVIGEHQQLFTATRQ
ncbi:hypothetical protein MA5S0422_3684 [Mycobacteroides abscessus 5S-0422]|uniref:Uncharacterized protein n=2 Tax=Mycobacteroides abscessus TaxID=36809 RepID=A0A829Q721_9MYCO|nr:hypothetical protein MA5S0422_3684 [Mycobacteroides abscessus 5S-0422]EIU26405.1 hypothetical protein MA5S0708_2221 [Mycobacteroides abscessus 5S-0708]EIU31853.1 hypothetical protein MA5S1212_2190 [Mycobacteroides abscessus 5S-1212]EUA48381.1 hypothetical protein I543_3449 [Mycobacteroides abscessus 21]EUA69959.1 hypothetical protein I540_3723 [Mycobacteroides abscessus subsp. bolletii 1513]